MVNCSIVVELRETSPYASISFSTGGGISLSERIRRRGAESRSYSLSVDIAEDIARTQRPVTNDDIPVRGYRYPKRTTAATCIARVRGCKCSQRKPVGHTRCRERRELGLCRRHQASDKEQPYRESQTNLESWSHQTTSFPVLSEPAGRKSRADSRLLGLNRKTLGKCRHVEYQVFVSFDNSDVADSKQLSKGNRRPEFGECPTFCLYLISYFRTPHTMRSLEKISEAVADLARFAKWDEHGILRVLATYRLPARSEDCGWCRSSEFTVWQNRTAQQCFMECSVDQAADG